MSQGLVRSSSMWRFASASSISVPMGARFGGSVSAVPEGEALGAGALFGEASREVIAVGRSALAGGSSLLLADRSGGGGSIFVLPVAVGGLSAGGGSNLVTAVGL